MAGYVVVELTVTDPTAFEQYRAQVGATVEKYGGNSSCAAARPSSSKATGLGPHRHPRIPQPRPREGVVPLRRVPRAARSQEALLERPARTSSRASNRS